MKQITNKNYPHLSPADYHYHRHLTPVLYLRRTNGISQVETFVRNNWYLIGIYKVREDSEKTGDGA